MAQEKERLQADVAELNDTVFSKSFKAPSAWAEREVKYKMEKRDWESKVDKLRQQLRALQAENAAYRAASKTSELEEQIAVRPACTKCPTYQSCGNCAPFFLFSGGGPVLGVADRRISNCADCLVFMYSFQACTQPNLHKLHNMQDGQRPLPSARLVLCTGVAISIHSGALSPAL